MKRRTQTLIAFTTAAAVATSHSLPAETPQEKPLAIVGEPLEQDQHQPHDEREEYSNERHRIRPGAAPSGAPPKP